MEEITQSLSQLDDLRERTMAAVTEQDHLMLRRIYVGLRGSLSPVYLIVGEAPGDMEEREGLAFSGVSGELLAKMLEETAIPPSYGAFTTILKVRPAKSRKTLEGPQEGNRRPTPEELELFTPFFKEELKMLKPQIISTLGSIPGAVCCDNPAFAVTRMRGTWHRYCDIPVMPTFAPSFLMHKNQHKRGQDRDRMVRDLAVAKLAM